MELIARIDAWGRRAPERVAYRSGGRALTWGALARDAGRLAAALARELPAGRAPVAVVGHKEPEMLVAFLGVLKTGRPYVPIDAVSPSQRNERILQAAGAALVLTPKGVAARLADAPGASAKPVALGPDDPWYIIFTSGSSGDPKGVVITSGCLCAFLDWLLAEHTFAPGAETFLNQAPFSFDLSVMDLYASLLSGGTLVSLTKQEIVEPKRLFAALAGSGTTVWVSTPTFAQLCLAEPTFRASLLPAVRRFLFCGETLAPAVVDALLRRFPAAEVWNTYGPTEATVATTSVRLDRAALERWSPLPVGRPRPGSRVQVLRADGRAAPDGERGEIVIAGPNVSPGYLGRPDLTAQAFFTDGGEQAYRTGDRGHFEEGLLFFDGRADNQIKLHGYRIELGDVEANLCALPGVRDAAVLAVPREGPPESLAAFVILARPPEATEFETARALRRELGRRLPAYMVPRAIHVLEAFPRTDNGKTDRRRLAERLG